MSNRDLEAILMRGRRWLPVIGIGLTLAIFAATIFLVTLYLRGEMRNQLINRDAKILHTVALSYMEDFASSSGPDFGSISEQTGVQTRVMLKTARLRDVIAARIFRTDGTMSVPRPFNVKSDPLTKEELRKLKRLQPLARYRPHANLDEIFSFRKSTDKQENEREPLLEVTLPLHRKGSEKLLGVAQLIFGKESLVSEFSALDRQLGLQAAAVFLVGGTLIVTTLGSTFRRLQHSNRLLEEKSKRVQEHTKELQETRLEIVRRLGRAAEYRDTETGVHILHMSRMTAMLGSKVGLDHEQVDLLLNASPMHDVGKIGIPDSILLKPGKLDPEEWRVMKSHAVIGGEILSGHNSELLEMARRIALTHHEKWDGTGYPYGLCGKDIPLEGRIAALADVFDALTSKRPYKRAWSVEEAVVLIRDNRGYHFDPHLVDLFLAHLDEFKRLRNVPVDSQHRAIDLLSMSKEALPGTMRGVWHQG